MEGSIEDLDHPSSYAPLRMYAHCLVQKSVSYLNILELHYL